MTAAVAQIPTTDVFKAVSSAPRISSRDQEASPKPRDIHTELHFYKDPEDGGPPHPTYVDRPETYERPHETHPVVIRDVRGREAEYTLDRNGFEFIRRPALEKDFLDDEQVKAIYYPEVEQLLKDA